MPTILGVKILGDFLAGAWTPGKTMLKKLRTKFAGETRWEACRQFRRTKFKEEGRGTRNGYEASKGSKGISGL